MGQCYVFLLRVINNRGAVTSFFYGFFNNITSVVSEDFENLVYSKSYGGAVYLNGSIVTGAKQIFEASKESPHSIVSTFLSGKFLYLFSIGAMTFELSYYFKGTKKYIIISLGVLSIISGNTSLFMLFLLLQSPFFLFILRLFVAVAILYHIF